VTGLDYAICIVYMLVLIGVGVYHMGRNESREDYFVGGRSVKAHHVGLSIVATDVGGGFSIGLGGVGFAMGLAGSWLLFTGLVGAWLVAVFIIPRIKLVDRDQALLTYPDFLRLRYDERVALVAAAISAVGYMGFTGAQILAGAKLASTTIVTWSPWGLSRLDFAMYVIAFVTIVYTVIGGLKAVIYTDTIQWAVLLGGLLFVTVPVAIYEVGGMDGLRSQLPASHFSLFNVAPVTFINWMVTIIPIWLVGMTLYQRIYACSDEKEAKKAWYIAGVFEYPVMAFTGVFLGMCARVLFPNAEPELGLPMLIRDVLPMGVTGIVIASYFSAIMSTADSCLMASSGNVVNDLIDRHLHRPPTARTRVLLSQVVTCLIGLAAIVVASHFATVLDAILQAYAFMVSGLFIPTLGAYFWRRASSAGAMAGMLGGGGLTLLLLTKVIRLPAGLESVGLDPAFYGILASLGLFVVVSLLRPERRARAAVPWFA
jgi:SSS family solute:Na+ symporter